jgi:hypothetical protein
VRMQARRRRAVARGRWLLVARGGRAARSSPPPLPVPTCFPVYELPPHVLAAHRLLTCRRSSEHQSAAPVGSSSAVILDMGEFEAPGLNTAATQPSHRPTSTGAATGDPPPFVPIVLLPSAPPVPAPLPDNQASAAAADVAADGGNEIISGHSAPPRPAAADPPPRRVRLYSVLAPCLAGRARLWGAQLALRDAWRQTDRGFFDAPGAARAACVSPWDGPRPLSVMPLVTFGFAEVEGGRDLVRSLGAADARAVARLLKMVLVAALDAVPGGYLCREQVRLTSPPAQPACMRHPRADDVPSLRAGIGNSARLTSQANTQGTAGLLQPFEPWAHAPRPPWTPNQPLTSHQPSVPGLILAPARPAPNAGGLSQVHAGVLQPQPRAQDLPGNPRGPPLCPLAGRGPRGAGPGRAARAARPCDRACAGAAGRRQRSRRRRRRISRRRRARGGS